MILINLFSIFDPARSINYSLNWLSLLYVILFIPNLYWFIPSRYSYFFILILNFLVLEFKILLNLKINVINIILFIRLFIIILLNNFIGLFCYIFTATSHISVNLSLSLILWVLIILFGWINYTNHIFIHLVPSGTPTILIPFIVLIERISNFIRPITLSVRLAANIIAGHLLITLISSTGTNLNFFLLLIILLVQSVLIVLELRVSVIQAYVFSVLRTLYRAETSH